MESEKEELSSMCCCCEGVAGDDEKEGDVDVVDVKENGPLDVDDRCNNCGVGWPPRDVVGDAP